MNHSSLSLPLERVAGDREEVGAPHALAIDDQERIAVQRAASRALASHSFCTLATSSARNRPHVVGVIYVAVEGRLYIHTLETSRKARNIRDNPHVGVCIPVRRIPLAPPFCLQFQAAAEVLAVDDPEILALLAERPSKMKAITAHGALAVPGACFIRVTPGRRVSTFGLGLPLRTILRDPFHSNRTVPFEQVAS